MRLVFWRWVWTFFVKVTYYGERARDRVEPYFLRACVDAKRRDRNSWPFPGMDRVKLQSAKEMLN